MKDEKEQLIDELVAKGGPTTGQIKKDQDLDKVARLIELGWEPETKVLTLEARVKRLEGIVGVHEKKIHQCSIQR